MSVVLVKSPVQCLNCGKWHVYPDQGVKMTCMVNHSPDECCHLYELEVEEEK